MRVAEANPPSPGPQEGRGEGAVLKLLPRQCMQLLPDEELRLVAECVPENMEELGDPVTGSMGPQAYRARFCLGKDRNGSPYQQQASFQPLQRFLLPGDYSGCRGSRRPLLAVLDIASCFT